MDNNNIEQLKDNIREYIKQNGNKEITGQILQDVLLGMVDGLVGNDAVANPEGEAAKILNKIGIAGTVYTAPQGPQGVSPTVQVTQNENGYHIVITDKYGAHAFDLTNGPANTLTIGTVQSGQTAAANITGEAPNQVLNLTLPKGEQGDPGQNAVNPFKGWFTTDNIPTTGQEGDYCNISDTSVTPHTVTIYRWNNSQNAFVDTGEVPDTATGETFASGETLQQVAIDDSRLTNPVNPADPTQPVLAQAEYVMDLKAKLEGVTAIETKAEFESIDGFINGQTGTVIGNGYTNFYADIVLPAGIRKVRFLGFTSTSDWNYYPGASFIHYDEDENFVMDKKIKFSTTDQSEAKEYSSEVPELSTHLRVSLKVFSYADIRNQFYCYLISGYPALSRRDVVDNLDSTLTDLPLSANMGRQLNEQDDALQLKLGDATLTEVMYNVNVEEDVNNGYVDYDGSIHTSGSTIQYITINVDGHNRVRFLGVSRQSGSTYCAFYDEDDNVIEGSIFRMESGMPETTFKEYTLNVPSVAVYFKTIYKTSAISGLPEQFYCYLQDGYPAASVFKNGRFIGDYNVDITPKKDSGNLVSSGGVFDFVINSTPKMFNPKVDLLKPNLKILDIGNSYTQDATQYLDEIIGAIPGVSETGFSLYKYIRASGSFKTALDCYNGNDTVGYYIVKQIGDTIPTVETQTTLQNDGGAKFRKLLNDTKWDIIIIHQESSAAVDYSKWQGDGAGGYLNQYVQLLRKTNPQAAIGTMIIHSYAHRLGQAGPTLARWGMIADAIKQFAQQYGIDFVIPYGTAVECVRMSTLNDGNDFSTDGTHLAEGIGIYVANCVYYQAVFAPRFGVPILGNSWTKMISNPNAGEMSVDSDTAPIAQRAAMWATYNWYTVVNADDL